MDTISVIIPVYNSENYIKDCLTSILLQSYKNMEIIIVDDGSTDNSCKVAKDLLSASDVDYKIVHQENQGVSVARNRGIELAEGSWIIAIDSDDCINRDTFKMIMENIGDADVAFFDFKINGAKDGDPIWADDIIFLSGKDAIEGFYSRKYKFIAPASLIRKRFLIENNIKYDETCKFAEDDLYVWKILCRVNRVLYIKQPLYHYIFHGNSTMTTSDIRKFMSTKEASMVTNVDFVKKSENAEHIKEEFLYRHYLGILHAAAKVQGKQEFCSLINFFELSEIYQEIRNELLIRTRIKFGFILRLPDLVYWLFRIV